MITSFNPSHGLILVDAIVYGPAGYRNIRLGLDTGATRTLIHVGVLATIGITLPPAGPSAQVTMGNSVQSLPLVEIVRMEALGRARDRLEVTAHTLPRTAGVEGLLGLDFFRLRRLTIDFRRGQIRLA